MFSDIINFLTQLRFSRNKDFCTYLVWIVSTVKVPFVIITIRSFPYTWLFTGLVTRVTWGLPLVEQELLTFPPLVFSGIHIAQSLVFCVVFCRSLFVLLAIALYALLRFTVSDYPFGIFKLILKHYMWSSGFWNFSYFSAMVAILDVGSV